MMRFTVEEENLICMYHNADRRRTIGKITAAMRMLVLCCDMLHGYGVLFIFCFREYL